MGKLFGSKPQQSTTESAPWEPAQGALKDILKELSGWYSSAKDQGYISSTGDLSGIYGDYLNALQGSQSGIQDLWGQGTGALSGAQDTYKQLASGGMALNPENINQMAGQFVDNDLLQSQIEAATRDDVRNLTENLLPNIDRQAVAGGNMGSSRAGVAQAVAQRGTEERISDTSATMRGQAYQNALNQAMGIAQGNVQQQLAGAGGLGSTANQYFGAAGNYGNVITGPLGQIAGINQMIQGAGQADKIGERDYLFNLLGNYANIAGGIGGMGGTQTGTASGGGGSMFDKLVSGGSMVGSFFSDKRLKKNIQEIGDYKGHKVYQWEWTDEAKKFVGNQGTFGVIAQDFADTNPDAVSMDKSGYFKVDYSKL